MWCGRKWSSNRCSYHSVVLGLCTGIGVRLPSNQGFDWVCHEPILNRTVPTVESHHLDGTVLEAVPLRVLVDDLAHAVVAHNRSLRPLPEALSIFANLFDAQESDGTQLQFHR